MPFQATLLSITGAGVDFSDYAVRDLTMTLAPIGQAVQMSRTINGVLIDLSQPQFQNKYQAVVSCSDQESPGFANVLPGTPVTVVCIPQLGVNSETPLTLQMLVGGWNEQRAEWPAESSWSLPLESV